MERYNRPDETRRSGCLDSCLWLIAPPGFRSKMVPASPLIDFSYDFRDLLITPLK
jgi:hypothetical protein